jgi:DinB superfamily
MDTKQAIRSSLTISDFLLSRYLEDITPDELVARPVAGANNIAWQLGHLISAERNLVEAASPGSMPELPAGFREQHSKEKAASDNRADYLSKDEYLRLAKEVRANTLRALERLSDADLDKPATGRVPPFIKTAGECFVLIGPHWASHAGQWVVLRRKLGRPVMF